jgi:hypothetical protein
MATDLHDQPAVAEPSMTSLMTGIVSDTQALLKQEIALARCEFKEELHKMAQAGISFGIGVGLLAIGAFFVLVMLALVLSWALALPAWVGFGIFGGLLVVIGGGLLFFAKSRVEDVHLVPPQTAATLKESAQWLKNQT